MHVQWGHSRQRLYCERLAPNRPWFVVIHGGAWRDPRITDETGFNALDWAKSTGKYGGVASLDYRLSPEVSHPSHLEDVEGGMKKLVELFNPPEFVILGHSCGAFMAGQLASRFKGRISAVIGLEGIYDLRMLTIEYPDYSFFVELAFGHRFPTVNWSKVPLVVIHSKDDELLSMKQAEFAAKDAETEVLVIEGLHDQTFEEFSEFAAPAMQFVAEERRKSETRHAEKRVDKLMLR